MVDSEREILREREDSGFGERRPFESSRQATYEDSAAQHDEWEHQDSDS